MTTLTTLLSDLDPECLGDVAEAILACRSTQDAQTLWDHLLTKVSPADAAGWIEAATLEIEGDVARYAAACLFDDIIPRNILAEPSEG